MFHGVTFAPEGVNQLIIVSGFGDVLTFGDFLKLYIATAGERSDTRRAEAMAADAPGNRNEALILPVDGHGQAVFDGPQGSALLDAVMARLNEFRPN